MQVVPLQAVPVQTTEIQLDGQGCTINLRQRTDGLYLTLLVNNQLIISEVIAQNQNFIVISKYLGFLGDLMFIDNNGTSDPDYTGLGPDGRFTLMYVPVAELPP